MASLRVLKGPGQGSLISLEQEKITFGRNPDCDVVIPVTSVSREHAQIHKNQNQFFIVDLQSRNHTFVNNEPISTRIALRNNDKIRICDFLAVFQDSTLPPLPPELTRYADDSEPEPDSEGEPNIESTLTSSKGLLLETQPAEMIQAFLEISSNLSKTLQAGFAAAQDRRQPVPDVPPGRPLLHHPVGRRAR